MGIFLLLFFVSFAGLVVGLIKPSIFRHSRKVIGLVFGGALALFFVLFGATVPPSDAEPLVVAIAESSVGTESTPDVQVQSANQPLAPKSPQIVQTSKERSDGGIVYYLLIDPIELSDQSFKNEVMDWVRDMVAAHGAKASFNFFDDAEALKLAYRQYGSQSLGRARTVEENALLERHYVASFDGKLQTGLYSNTLTFFPMAIKSSATVGKYVASSEFNP